MRELNWAGTHAFVAPRVVEATSVADVQDAVRGRVGRLRALGTRHSFNDIADSDRDSGAMITIGRIDPAPSIDEPARTVTVGGGTRYGDLAVWLEARGWALHNLGSLPHISIAGATATGTHGSGDDLGTLSSAVRGLEFVDAIGDLRTVDPNHHDFPGYVVHLGAIGIITRVTLAIEPTYLVRQEAYGGVPWDLLLEHPSAITGSGYSVSVFARWTDDTVAVIRKIRFGTEPDDVPAEWAGATRLTQPIIESDAWTEQGGAPGPWLHRLPHFTLESTPSVGNEIQAEYFVDRADAIGALRAIRALGVLIDPHLVVSELRTIKADDLWLSGAYGRDTMSIHFTWKRRPSAVARVLPEIEAALAPFRARPHWGKWHCFDAERIAHVHPRFADAAELFRGIDPEGVFANSHLERMGFRR